MGFQGMGAQQQQQPGIFNGQMGNINLNNNQNK